MPDRPKAGERFTVVGRRDLLTVAECNAVVSNERTVRYVVTSTHGARWSLVRTDDGWLGTALPADPNVPDR